MKKKIDTQAFLDAWFTFEEILSIQKWVHDIETGNISSEKEFWDNVQSKKHIINNVYV